MAIQKVACPKCRAVLKSAKPMQAGARVTCPGCKTLFAVPAEVLVAVAAGAPPPAAGGAFAGGTPPAPLLTPGMSTVGGAALASTVTDAAAPAIALPPRNTPARRFALILGGAVGVLLVTTIVVLACFWGGGATTTNDEELKDLLELADLKFKKKSAAPKPLIELSKEDQEIVDEMVKKGVAYLKLTQLQNGSWGAGQDQWDNFVCFGGLTLLECGVPPNDPAVQKAAKYARSRMPAINRTYPAALFLLFFDKLHAASAKASFNDPDAAKDVDHIRELAMRLVVGQLGSGGWTYHIPILTGPDVERTRGLLEDMHRGGRTGSLKRTRAEVRRNIEDVRKKSVASITDLPPGIRRAGVLHAPTADANPGVFRGGGDNSNTQFALLALWAARRHRIPVDPALDLVVRRFQNSQNEDGSFNYAANHNVVQLPTMTCAGLLGLAVGYGLAEIREGPGAPKDPAIQKAIDHLSKSVGDDAKLPKLKKKGKGNAQLTMTYYLWSVERVAVLFQLKTINDKDWYHWGMNMLHDTQREDGAWHSSNHSYGPFTDTCFCLLFLQRANLAQDLTDKLEELEAAAEGPVIGAALPRKEP